MSPRVAPARMSPGQPPAMSPGGLRKATITSPVSSLSHAREGPPPPRGPMGTAGRGSGLLGTPPPTFECLPASGSLTCHKGEEGRAPGISGPPAPRPPPAPIPPTLDNSILTPPWVHCKAGEAGKGGN